MPKIIRKIVTSDAETEDKDVNEYSQVEVTNNDNDITIEELQLQENNEVIPYEVFTQDANESNNEDEEQESASKESNVNKDNNDDEEPESTSNDKADSTSEVI